MEKNIKLRPRSRRSRTDLYFCQDCDKPLTDENWTPSQQKYKRYICGPCYTIRQKKYAKSDPNYSEKKKARDKVRIANWSAERKEEERKKLYDGWLKRKYGITLKEYHIFLDNQNNKCAICEATEAGGMGSFHLDHCHNTGEIRGILCQKCNMMLGLASDNIKILNKAIKYLGKEKNIDEFSPISHRIGS